MRLPSLIGALMLTVACGRAGLPDTLSDRLQTLADHTPGMVQDARPVGIIDDAQRLDLRLQLPVRDAQELDDLVAAVSDPESSLYHQYLSPEAFRERFYPAREAIEGLKDALRDAGFETADAPQGGVLAARVAARQAERFFNTRILNYVAADGTPFFAPDQAVRVPAGLPIAGVFGLHSGPPERHDARVQDAMPNAVVKLALSPNDLRNAYNVPPSARGAGQYVAVVELDGFNMADLLRFESTYNLPNVPITTVLLDGFDGSAGPGAIEVNLDLDVLVGMAPDLAGIRLIEAPNTIKGFFDTFNECANPSQGDKLLPPVVSCSWGSPETARSQSDMQAFSQVFQQMAAQGQTVFVASGDFGATADQKTVGVQDPSSQPFVVGVGGTTLAANLALPSGAYTSESVWTGSGGGFSKFWPIPAYQKGLDLSVAKGSASARNVPDVALNADPNTGYIIVSGGKTLVAGGTSAAAPLWAGFLAQVNAQRASTGLEPMGFLNPVLYNVGRGSKYGANFHDVADNTTNGLYPGVTGFDNATGWGSFQGATLLQTLSAGFARRPFKF